MNERTEIAPQQTAGSPEGTSCPVCSQLLPRPHGAPGPSAPCGRPGKCLRTSRRFFLRIICLSGIKCLSLQKHGEKRDDTIL